VLLDVGGVHATVQGKQDVLGEFGEVVGEQHSELALVGEPAQGRQEGGGDTQANESGVVVAGEEPPGQVECGLRGCSVLLTAVVQAVVVRLGVDRTGRHARGVRGDGAFRQRNNVGADFGLVDEFDAAGDRVDLDGQPRQLVVGEWAFTQRQNGEAVLLGFQQQGHASAVQYGRAQLAVRSGGPQPVQPKCRVGPVDAQSAGEVAEGVLGRATLGIAAQAANVLMCLK
jgi:hypothetical protein